MEDIAKQLERMIAVYFNGHNYFAGEYEFSRVDSKVMAYELIHTLQTIELIMARKK